MSIIVWIIFGAIAGWVASLIVSSDGNHSLVGDVVIGILGALIGGFIMTRIGGSGISGFNITSLLVAIFGSVVLLLVARTLRHSA